MYTRLRDDGIDGPHQTNKTTTTIYRNRELFNYMEGEGLYGRLGGEGLWAMGLREGSLSAGRLLMGGGGRGPAISLPRVGQ